MSSKRNINKPKKVSTLLPSIFKKLNKKNNNELLEIKVNWKKIIGDDLCEKCYVSTLKKVNNRNVLTIISESSEIFEISYSSDVIKKKINKYFLREVVDLIKFKKSLQI